MSYCRNPKYILNECEFPCGIQALGPRGPPGPPGPPAVPIVQTINVVECPGNYPIQPNSNIVNIVNNATPVDWLNRITTTNLNVNDDFSYACCAENNHYYVTSRIGEDQVNVYNSPNGSTLGLTGPVQVLSNNDYNIVTVDYDSSGIVQWIVRIAGSTATSDPNINMRTSGNPISLSSFGRNTYISGIYEKPQDPGVSSPIILNLFNSNNGSTFAFSASPTNGNFPDTTGSIGILAKYNPQGEAQWISFVSGPTGPQNYENRGVYACSDDVFVVGLRTINDSGATGDIYFYNGTTGAVLPTISLINNDINFPRYLIRYNDQGVIQWVVIAELLSLDGLFNDVTCNSQNVFAVGTYQGSGAKIYPPISSSQPLPMPIFNLPLIVSSGGIGFLSIFDLSGNITSVSLFSNCFRAITLNVIYHDNFIYVLFQPADGNTTIYNAIQNDTETPIPVIFSSIKNITKVSDHIALIKYDLSGNPIWLTFINNFYIDRGNSQTNVLDVCDDGIYIAGTYYPKAGNIECFKSVSGLINTPEIGLEIPVPKQASYTIKYNFDGDPVWASKVSTTTDDYVASSSVTCDGLCNVYTSGVYYNTSSDDLLEYYRPLRANILGITGPAGIANNTNIFNVKIGECPNVLLLPDTIDGNQKIITYETSTNSCVDIIPSGTTIAGGGVTSLTTDQDGSTIGLIYTTNKYFVTSNNRFSTI